MSRQGISDVFVSAVPQLVGVLTGFASSILIARGLGPSGIGQYALVVSLASIATTLSDLGIGQTAIRFASRASASGDAVGQMVVLRWAFRLRLGLVMIVTAAFLLISPFVATRIWHSEQLTPYLRFGLLGGIFAAFASVPTIYFQSIKQFSANSMVTCAQRVVSFLGIVLLACFGLWSLVNLIAVNLVVSAIGALIFLAIVPKSVFWPDGGLRRLKSFTLQRFLTSPPVPQGESGIMDSSTPTRFVGFHMLATVITMLTMQADVWMMGYYLDTSALGIYSVATRFTLPLTIVLGALNTALWPRASGLMNPDALRRLTKKTFGFSLLLASAGAIYAVDAPLLAPWLFGSDYAESRLLGQVLSLRYCFAILICPVTIIGYSLGLVRSVWLINLMQLFMLVSINAVLLPRIGPLGSGLALLNHEIVGSCIVGLIILRKLQCLNRRAR